MKTKISLLILLFSYTVSTAQNTARSNSYIEQGINPSLNLPDDKTNKDNNVSFTTIKSTALGLTCNTNTFWCSLGSSVLEFVLSGATITPTGQTVSSPNMLSIAFCDNINGNSFSPTLYCEENNAIGVYYYDGSLWVMDSVSPPGNIKHYYNNGGHGNLLYMQGRDSLANDYLVKYDGTVMTIIYSFAPKKISAADISVDDFGNAWVVSGTGFGSPDSILVISPSGQVIKQYAFSFNTGNAYGTFLMNGIFYLGLGGGNPVAPNTLLPVTFSLNTATVGTPIPMPNTGGSDLASCNPGNPLGGIDPDSFSTYGLDLYPNPTRSGFTITSPYTITRIKIINPLGQVVYQSLSNNKNATIQLSKTGVYFVSIETEKGTMIRKVVKQ